MAGPRRLLLARSSSSRRQGSARTQTPNLAVLGAERYDERAATHFAASGPVGDDTDRPPIDARVIEELTARTGARAATIFAGRLEPETLGLGERLVIALVNAPSGDCRDWTAIKAWAKEIASALPVTSEGATPTSPTGQGRTAATRMVPTASAPASPTTPTAGPD